MREYTWKEAGKIEGISHKELTSLQMLQYVDWFRMDREVFEFEKGVELYTLFQYYFEKDEIVNKIPMKSTGTVGIKGIEDEMSLREQRGSFLASIKKEDLTGVTTQDDNIKFNTIDYVYDDFQVKGTEVKKLKNYDKFYENKYIFRRFLTNEGKRSVDSFSDYLEMEDEDLKDWKMLYSADHHKIATDYFEIFLKKEYEKKYTQSIIKNGNFGNSNDNIKDMSELDSISESIDTNVINDMKEMDDLLEKEGNNEEIPKNVRGEAILSDPADINFYEDDYTLKDRWYNKMGLQKYEYSGFTAHVLLKEVEGKDPKLLLLFRGSDGGEDAFATNRDGDWLYTNAKYGVSGYTDQFTCVRMFYEVAIEMYKRVIYEEEQEEKIYVLGNPTQQVTYHDKNIYISGHSLGGGLTQYAAMVSASIGHKMIKDGLTVTAFGQSEEDKSLYSEDGHIKHYAASFNGPGMKLQGRFNTNRLTNYANLLAEPIYALKEMTQEIPFIGNVLGEIFQVSGDSINVLTGIIGESFLRKIPPFNAAGKAGDLAGQGDLQTNAPLYFAMRTIMAGETTISWKKYLDPTDHGFKRNMAVEDVADNEFFDFLISEGYIKKIGWNEGNLLEVAKKRRNYGYRISDKSYLQKRDKVNDFNNSLYKDKTIIDSAMKGTLGKVLSVFGGLELYGELDLDVYFAIIKRYGRHVRIDAVGDKIIVSLKPMFYVNSIKKLLNDNFGLISYIAMESSSRLRMNVNKLGGKMNKNLGDDILKFMRAGNLLSLFSSIKFLASGELIIELVHLEALKDILQIKPVIIDKVDPFSHFDKEEAGNSIFDNMINIKIFGNKKRKNDDRKVVEQKREEYLMNYFINCLNNTRIVQRSIMHSDSFKTRINTGDYKTWWRNPRQMDKIPLNEYKITYEKNTGFDKIKSFLMRKDLTPNLIPSIGLKIEVDYGRYLEDDRSGSGNRAIGKVLKFGFNYIGFGKVIGEGTDPGNYHAISNFMPFIKFDENDGLTGDDGDLEKNQFMHRKVNMETIRSYVKVLAIESLDKSNFKKLKKIGKPYKQNKLYEAVYNTKQWDTSINIPSFNFYNVNSEKGREGTNIRAKIFMLNDKIAKNISSYIRVKYKEEFFDKEKEEIITVILKDIMEKSKFPDAMVIIEHIKETFLSFMYEKGIGEKNVYLGEGNLGSNYQIEKLIEKKTNMYKGEEVKSIYIGHINAKNKKMKEKTVNNYKKSWHSEFFDEWLGVEKVVWTTNGSNLMMPGYLRIDSKRLETPLSNGIGLVSREPTGQGRFYVVNGAKLSCPFLEGSLILQQNSQTKESIEGKLLVTNLDKTMIPTGKCGKGGICTCISGSGEWDSVSSAHEVAGLSPVLADAKIRCSVYPDVEISIIDPNQSMKKEN